MKMSNHVLPGLTVTCRVHVRRGAKGQVELRAGHAVAPPPPAVPGRVPKLARLMALAVRFDGLLRRGEVRDYAELARLGHVSRARVTQVMNLLNLAPDIQEQVLFLPPTTSGRDAVREWQVRSIAAEPVWARQRRAWRQLAINCEEANGPSNPHQVRRVCRVVTRLASTPH